MRRLLFIVACASFFATLPAWSQDDVEKGIEAFTAYRNATKAYSEAVGAGDSDAISEQFEAASAALSQARGLLELGRADLSNDHQILATYGDVLRLTGDFDLAVQAYRRASEFAPGRATVWLNLGRALVETGESKEAVDAYRRSIEAAADPELQAEAMVELGNLYLKRGVHALAEEQYTAALEVTGEFIVAKIALMSLKVRMGKVAEAEKELEELGESQALYSAPMLSYLSMALKDFDEARLWVPDDAANQLAYAKLLARAGRTTDAIAPLKRSLALDGDHYVGWNLLGSLYRQIGDAMGAQNAFVRSLEIEPDQPRTFEALEALGGPPQ